MEKLNKRKYDFEKKKIMPHNLPAQWLASHVHEYDEKSVGVKSTHPKLCNSFRHQWSMASHEIVAPMSDEIAQWYLGWDGSHVA
jgi:hypothetical protein